MILDCFEHRFYFFCIGMEFQKIVNFLDTTSDDKDFPRFVTKKCIEVYDESENNYSPKKEIKSKHQYEDQIYAIILMRMLL